MQMTLDILEVLEELKNGDAFSVKYEGVNSQEVEVTYDFNQSTFKVQEIESDKTNERLFYDTEECLEYLESVI